LSVHIRLSGKTVWQSAFGLCSAMLKRRVLRFETREIASCLAMTDGKARDDENNHERSFADAQDDEIKREIASFLAMTYKGKKKDPSLRSG